MTTTTANLADYYEFLKADAWSGSASEVAAKATEFGVALGIIEPGRPFTERLVRDYVAREVLDKPVRCGKEAVYRPRHVDQLLEARQLLNGGLKLQGLATALRSREVAAIRIRESDIDAIHGAPPIDLKSAAQRAIDEIRASYPGTALDQQQAAARVDALVAKVGTSMRNALRNVDQLKDLRYRLSQQADDFPAINQKRIELVDGLALVIEQERIAALKEEDIPLIAKSVELLLERIVRESKSP